MGVKAVVLRNDHDFKDLCNLLLYCKVDINIHLNELISVF